MSPEEIRKFSRWIKRDAARLGLHELDVIVQAVLCKMLEGRKTGTRNMIIDYVRTIYGSNFGRSKKQGQRWNLSHTENIEDHVFDDSYKWKPENKLTAEKLMSFLSERDFKIMHLYFYQGWTAREISVDLQVTETRVAQIMNMILQDLREYIEMRSKVPVRLKREKYKTKKDR